MQKKISTVVSLLLFWACGACTAGTEASGKGETSLTGKRAEETDSNSGNPTPAEEVQAPSSDERDNITGDAADMPTDPKKLKKRALEEIKAGHIDEALAIIDVLLVMRPDDLETLELRGELLIDQGHAVDGASDLKRCCNLGRPSCCR